MKEPMTVDVIERLGNLLYDVPALLVREWVVVQLAHLHHSIQVHIEQLKHHVKSVVVPDHLHASHDVCMLETDHRFDFGVTDELLTILVSERDAL